MAGNYNNGIQEKIKEVLSKAKSCALIAEENPNEETFLLRSAFELGLESLGMAVISLPKKKENKSLKFYQEKWLELFESAAEEKFEEPPKTIIKIPKKDVAIKELSYNEDDDFFSLVITPKNKKLTKEITIFEEALPEPETIVCFFEEREKLENFKNQIKPPPQEKIIFLTPNHIKNEKAGQKTFTEKIVTLMQLLEIHFSPSILNLALAALIIETNHFKDYSNKEIFSLANFLLSRGADAKQIKSIQEKQNTNSFVRLLGRAAARTHYDEQTDVSWSFIARKDFEKTDSAPSDELILKITKGLEKLTNPSKIFAVCWQEEKGILAMLKSSETSFLANAAANLNSRLQSDYFITGPFQSFSEAEIKIKKALFESN